MRHRLPLSSLLLTLPILAAAGCGPGETDSEGTPMPGGEPSDPAADTLAMPEDTTAPADTVARPADPTSIEGVVRTHPWTADIVDHPDSGTGVTTVTGLETEGLPDMDRVVVTMDGSQPPEYHVEYVDEPIRECGSGRAIEAPGDGWLQLRLNGARGHTEAGEATLTGPWETPDLGVVLRIDRTCDFEGVVVLVLSVSSPNHYRLSVAESPNRLVLDVRHEGGDR